MQIKIKNHHIIKDIKILHFHTHDDVRGSFSRKFCSESLRNLRFKIKQVNLSSNLKKGTVRGLHFLKKPSKEKKIIFCVSGEVFDVIVDLRKDSKTYKKSISITLNKNNLKGVYIPYGFAHGFQTTKNNTSLIYYHSDFYDKNLDSGINALDNQLDIKWPLKISMISKKDRDLPTIEERFK